MGKAPSGSFPESVYASGDITSAKFMASGLLMLTRMADTCVVDFDSNFVRSRRFNLDIFDCKISASFPRHRGLLGFSARVLIWDP